MAAVEVRCQTSRWLRVSSLLAKPLQTCPERLKSVADDLKGKWVGVVALITENEGKASLVVGVTADLADKLSAVDLVRAGSEAVGGKGGGGRPDMAGGRTGRRKADAALAAIESAIAAST